MSKTQDSTAVKLLILGNSGVGKTCLLLRFSENEFKSSFMSTIGIDFKVKKVEVNGHKMKLQIWDTAGQEKFKHITKAYCRGSHGVLFVFDVNDDISFYNVREWIKTMEENCENTKLCRVLVGNKCDFDVKYRKIDESKALKFANEYQMQYIECSAKTGQNVTEAFMLLAQEIYDTSPIIKRKSIVELDKKNNSKIKCCNLM